MRILVTGATGYAGSRLPLLPWIENPMDPISIRDALYYLVAAADSDRGLTPVDDAIAASVSTRNPRPVNALADPHHLADSDPDWAGGDVLALHRRARAVTPAKVRLALGLVSLVPGPVAAVLRTGLDLLT